MLKIQELVVRSEVDAEEVAGETPTKEQLEVAGLLKHDTLSNAEMVQLRDTEAAQDGLIAQNKTIEEAKEGAAAAAKSFEQKNEALVAKMENEHRKSERKEESNMAKELQAVGDKYEQDKKEAVADKRREAVEKKQADEMNQRVAENEVDAAMSVDVSPTGDLTNLRSD